MMSCASKDNEPESPTQKSVKRCIIVYAINNSSLASDFKDDSNEMLKACSGLDISKYQLLVYRTESDRKSCGLYNVVKNKKGEPGFNLLKTYIRNVTSTDPDRIAEVINDALNVYPEAAHDLIFWGHGMSWKPYFTDHNIIEIPEDKAYGGEYNNVNGYTTTYTEVDDLARCVPDGKFDTIWFDCCYMSGIEVVYEFRNKCNTYVGYPTEVWQYGMAYDKTLPYLMKENPQVVDAAKAFYDEYAKVGDPVTVAVMDMSKVEDFASAIKTIYASGTYRPSEHGLLNYSRTASTPLYDLKQYAELIADGNNASFMKDLLDETYNKFVIYHDASDKNFSLRSWDTSHISGLSTHYYTGDDTRDEEYYRSLSWYKRVY